MTDTQNFGRSSNREGGERRSYNREDGERRSFNREGGDRRSFNREDGERRSYNREGGERSFNREGGERRSFNREDGDRRSYNREDGDRRSYNREGGERSFNRDSRSFSDKKRNTLYSNRNKDFRKDSSAKVRDFVYGCNSAFEVIRGGKRNVKSALISQSSVSSPRIKKLIEVLNKNNITWSTAEKGRLIDICESHEHQGVVLYCGEYPCVDMDKVFENDRVILLNNLEDPQNVGAVLRSAEIFGFKGVLLPEKGSPEIYPSVVKVAAGATEFLDICRSGNVTNYLAEAKDAGFTIISLDGKGNASFSDALAVNPEKILLVIGGEDKGVGQYVLNCSDFICSIPQRGKINSLNASVAAGIAMASL